ncbi:YfhO family protein [Candidatus Woesearchaeota archaeon]|nr:YfhO family protein [Candidatus Woesearchaeota archaeon]
MNDTLKRHLLCASIILLLILIVFYNFLDFNTIVLMDHVTSYYPRADILKQSITQFNDPLPLWNKYMGGGQPFFAKPDVQGFFYLLTIFFLILPTTLAALKAVYLFDIIFAGFAMYALVYYLKKDHTASIIGALIYTLNGWLLSRFVYGNLNTLNAYPFFPLILLFLLKAFKEERIIFNAVVAGILLGVQIHAGPDMKVTLFTLIAFAVLCLFQLFESFSTKNMAKIAVVVLIVGLVSFGLSAVKILPTKETLELSPRQHLNYAQSASRAMPPNQFFEKLVEPIRAPAIQNETISFQIGIIAFLLCCFAVYKKWKNKTIIYVAALVIISLLLASGSFLYYLLWKYVPPFDSFRYLDRTLVLYVFAASVLAALGASALFEYLKEKKQWGNKKVFMAKAAVIGLIFLNLGIFGNSPYYGWIGDLQVAFDNNQVINYIGEQPGIFRMHSFETKGIDWPTEPYSVPLGISNIFAYDGTWNTEYFNVFLGTSWVSPAKLWGILNVKYLTAQQPISLAGFRLIKKFDPCTVCFPGAKDWEKAWGPYLYENEEALPRAALFHSAVLIIGSQQNANMMNANTMTPAKQATYALLMSPFVNPKKTVIVTKEIDTISALTIEELKSFDAIILTQISVDTRTEDLLQQYQASGGRILPNILKGEQAILPDKLNTLFSSFNEDHEKISDEDIKWKNFDAQYIKFDKPAAGWLLLSETYSIYPGWKAFADGREVPIHQADGVITAVYLDKPTNEVKFEYKPRSFVIWAWVFIVTMMSLIAYFTVSYILKKN